MSSVLIFIAILGFLVTAHELGHFAVAKLRGVRVLEFGLGYPPKIFGFKYGETTYTLNLLPLGGFVRMHGEDGTRDSSDPHSFTNKGPFSRLAILAAGATVNAILPIFLFTFVAILPQEVPSSDVIIAKVEQNSPAQIAGLLPGDVIRVVDETQIMRVADLQKSIYLKLGANSEWKIERRGTILEVDINPRIDPPIGQGAVGIGIAEGKVWVKSSASTDASSRNSFLADDLILSVGGLNHDNPIQISEPNGVEDALAAAAKNTIKDGEISVLVWRKGDLIYLSPVEPVQKFLSKVEFSSFPTQNLSEPLHLAFWNSFGRLFEILILLKNEFARVVSGSASFDIAGPIGIAQITGEVANDGFITLITWTALLSINLAIINLLPIPALDGGRILFVLIELVSGGRRIAPDKEKLVHFIGFTVLLMVIILVSIQDIRRLI